MEVVLETVYMVFGTGVRSSRDMLIPPSSPVNRSEEVTRYSDEFIPRWLFSRDENAPVFCKRALRPPSQFHQSTNFLPGNNTCPKGNVNVYQMRHGTSVYVSRVGLTICTATGRKCVITEFTHGVLEPG